jgi:uncharacterized protein YneF (UPF0154 family)
MKEESDDNRFVLVGISIIVFLLLGIFVLIRRPKNNTQDNTFLSTNLSLNNSKNSESDNNSSGKYTDKACSTSFDYPKNWIISNTKLPLSQKPLTEAVFNENGGKNSIMFFICFDAKKYSFDQFMANNPFNQNQTEMMTIGNLKWQRVGNFAHTVKNDKLIIIQMFFTKYDLKPKDDYEQIFLDILKSVR